MKMNTWRKRKMAMNTMFTSMQAEAEKSWREKLLSEAGKINKSGKKLDNSDIRDKLLESLRLSNALLTRFLERVLCNDLEILLNKEMKEIDQIAELQANAEQKEQSLLVKTERLQNAKEQLLQLKCKIK